MTNTIELRPIEEHTTDDLAAEIQAEHKKAERALESHMQHCLRAGELLIKAKKTVLHGQWLRWLEDKCGINKRTAQAYMQLFAGYGGKSAAAAHLTSRDALQLIAKARDSKPEIATPDEDDVPGVDQVVVTVAGDVWECGDHRVLCGDAADNGDVSKLLDGREPWFLLADPPYGIKLDQRWRTLAGLNKKRRRKTHRTTSILGDDIADWSPAFALVPTLRVAYVFHAGLRTAEVAGGLEDIGFQLRQKIIWDKIVPVVSRQPYDWQTEDCWFAARRGVAIDFVGESGQSNAWRMYSPKQVVAASDDEAYDHPNQKPVALMKKPLTNHLAPGELVYDPFLGSGTTMIAAEQTGMVCLGIEKEPYFVDMAVKRWQDATGKLATLKGRAFAEVAEERGASHPQLQLAMAS